jgi:soluble lytic murein transglycosylase-like protein
MKSDNIDMMFLLGVAVNLIIIFFATAVWADIYRYVDEEGVACYTDIRFHKNSVRIIKTDPAPVHQWESNRESKKHDYHRIVKEKADKYEIDPSLVHAVIKAESNGSQYAVSRKGAMGLMQLMPSTAYELQVKDPFNPEENIDGGTRYLKSLIERFNGDLTLALAAYNAGPKTVEKSRLIPSIPETQQYVRRVLSLYHGKSYHPFFLRKANEEPERRVVIPIYKVVNEDGTILFTNSPLYKNLSRL